MLNNRLNSNNAGIEMYICLPDIINYMLPCFCFFSFFRPSSVLYVTLCVAFYSDSHTSVACVRAVSQVETVGIIT